MLKNININTNFILGLIAALLFCIPVFIYIKDKSYTQSWLLYLGSAFFCVVISIYTLFFNKTIEGSASTVQMIVASQVTVIIGVILSCIFCFAMLSLMVPDYLHQGKPVTIAPDTPASSVHGNSNGLGFSVFIGAILINFIFGAFFGSLLSFSAKHYHRRNAAKA